MKYTIEITTTVDGFHRAVITRNGQHMAIDAKDALPLAHAIGQAIAKDYDPATFPKMRIVSDDHGTRAVLDR